MADLIKEPNWALDTDVFKNLFGIYPIEQTIEMFQVWESDFVYYAIISKVFAMQKLAD